jgi:hypothetical protein
MLPQKVSYRVAPAAEVFVIKGSGGAYIDALRVSLAIVLIVTQVTDERHGRQEGMISDSFGGTCHLTLQAILTETPVLVKHHMKQISVKIDCRRVYRAGLLTLSFLFLTLTACNLDSL